MPEVQQPLHPSIIPRLDPQYRAFHEKELAYIVPPHTLPWDPAIRNAPAVRGGSDPLPVHAVRDIELTHTKARTFTPEGTAPDGGWPAFIFFHGGGWTLGNIASETSFSTNMCVRAKCVTISVDYRLAPENPYPKAIDDAVEALDWVIKHGKEQLNINPTRIAVGGSSSGGNIATILALKAIESKIEHQPIFQLLVVPVVDNTADTTNHWAENQHTCWLSPDRMNWFKKNYVPNPDDWKKWDVSPIFAPDDLLQKLPKTWIAVAELDILKNEGVAYGDKLSQLGVKVEVEIYKGAPHPIMAMDGALEIGAKLVTDASNALHKAFYS